MDQPGYQPTTPLARPREGRENIFERSRIARRPPDSPGRPGGRVAAAIIGAVRHNPSTVVVLAGNPSDQALAAVSRSMNVVLVRPDDGAADGVAAAAAALRRVAGVSAPYVLVAADPLAAVAAGWSAMWDLSDGARGGEEFELRAAEALAAWRAGQFELPDYYLVLADEGGPAAPEQRRPDFYLGPLRSVRPHRVAVAAAAEPAAQAAALLSELGTLRAGRWWPPLDEIFRTARGFYPGALAESPDAGRATLLS
jgi:hypothetical protein